MKAAEGLYKNSPRLHGNARGKDGFCPSGCASAPNPVPNQLPPPPLCAHKALWESKPDGLSELIEVRLDMDLLESQ